MKRGVAYPFTVNACMQTEDRFVECRQKDTPIAAVVIEPIQAEGGKEVRQCNN